MATLMNCIIYASGFVGMNLKLVNLIETPSRPIHTYLRGRTEVVGQTFIFVVYVASERTGQR